MGRPDVQALQRRFKASLCPAMVEGRRLPLSPQDILELPLACGKRWREDWVVWAHAAEVKIAEPRRIVEYESRAFMFDAALSGQAVILADSRMTKVDEPAGSLVQPSPIKVDRPQGFYVVSEVTPNPEPRLVLFENWMKQKAG